MATLLIERHCPALSVFTLESLERPRARTSRLLIDDKNCSARKVITPGRYILGVAVVGAKGNYSYSIVLDGRTYLNRAGRLTKRRPIHSTAIPFRVEQ